MSRPSPFALLLFVALPALAADPPALTNYQGVLRDAADAPLTVDFDMVFRFFDAESAGNEILIDQHFASNAQAVTVDGGLFSVALGGGPRVVFCPRFVIYSVTGWPSVSRSTEEATR